MYGQTRAPPHRNSETVTSVLFRRGSLYDAPVPQAGRAAGGLDVAVAAADGVAGAARGFGDDDDDDDAARETSWRARAGRCWDGVPRLAAAVQRSSCSSSS